MTISAALPHSLAYQNRRRQMRQATDVAGMVLVSLGLGVVAVQRGVGNPEGSDAVAPRHSRYSMAYELQQDETLRQMVQQKRSLEQSLAANELFAMQQALAAFDGLKVAVEFSPYLRSSSANVSQPVAQSEQAIVALDAAIDQRAREIVGGTLPGSDVDPGTVAHQALEVLHLSDRLDSRRHVSATESSLQKIVGRDSDADSPDPTEGDPPAASVSQNCVSSLTGSCETIIWSTRR
ncbi:MAG: hypothetical protein AAF289_11150 [Cyanobacteria bacterium P01_A01_bin.135]